MSFTASQKIVAVVPARYGSTRFPGKMIAQIAGKPVVWHTYQQVLRSELVSEVIIAADDNRILEALEPFDVPVVMTRPDHQSGTDRIAEVAANLDADIIVNVQGDEPLIDPHTVDEAIRPLLENPDIPMGTVKRKITDLEMVIDPNVVKVIVDNRGRAIYFSRLPIPYIRDEADRKGATGHHWQHIGLYVFRREFVMQFAKMAQTPLEKLEKLEQLRVLENGYDIAVVETEHESVGVDTPEDLERVRALIESR